MQEQDEVKSIRGEEGKKDNHKLGDQIPKPIVDHVR